MYDYIKGTVVELKYNSIVVDNNGIGYLIYVPNPYAFEVGKEFNFVKGAELFTNNLD